MPYLLVRESYMSGNWFGFNTGCPRKKHSKDLTLILNLWSVFWDTLYIINLFLVFIQDVVLLMDFRWQSLEFLVRNVQHLRTCETRRTGGWSSPPTLSQSSTVWRWWDTRLSLVELSLDHLLEHFLTRNSSGLCTDHPMTWITCKPGERRIWKSSCHMCLSGMNNEMQR